MITGLGFSHTRLRCGTLNAATWGFVFFTGVLVPLFAGEQTFWQVYNEGIQAYSKSDYTNAFQAWENLSLQKLPSSLRRPVWFQLGNVQFRMGEPLEQRAPEEAIELWRRSCQAYESALLVKPRDREVRHNRAFVQSRLASLLRRFGLEAFRSADNKPLDAAIGLLRTSTEELQEAANLLPEDPPIRADRDRAWRALRERLKERAQSSEKKADDLAAQANSWADEQAEEKYRGALDDLGEAHHPAADPDSLKSSASRPPPDALEQSIGETEARVQQKLSRLLTRRGQGEQKQGERQATGNPDQALGHYEAALDLYRSAQEVQSDNADARKGETEVRLAMEKLYVAQGRAGLQRGREALAARSPRAAPALSGAVSDFEAALQLNQNNAEARAGADEARRLLPEALNLAGKADLDAGDRAASESVTDALTHYQEAEEDFRQSLDLKPGQQPAEQGLREAEEKLARMRTRAAEEAEKAAKAGQPRNQAPKTLQALLGQVDEKERTPELQRERQRAQRNTGKGKYYADW